MLDSEAIAKARQTSAVSAKHKALRLLWSVVQATLYRGSFHTMSGWRAMLLRLFGAKVGKSCTIRRSSKVFYPWLLVMGDFSCLGDEVEVYNLGLVTLGDNVSLSQQAYICAGTHDYTTPAMPLLTMPISIGDWSWICAKAFIGPGVQVGEGAVVAAGSVVVKDVADWTIVGGNPAKFIKARERFSS